MNTFQSEPMVKNHVQKSELVNMVYKTDDLSIFKAIDGNRVPNLQHIKRLADSIRIYGMKCNPILVNEKMQVIDGQHRLLAAKEIGTFVYYIVLNGYTLSEVQTLNLNQKNWTKKDYMEGYANMGIEPYIKLRNFCNKNEDFKFSDCLSLCSNVGSQNCHLANKYSRGVIHIFEEGTWIGKDFELGQEWANKIRMIQPYYSNYNRSIFVLTLLTLFQNDNFDFNEFMHKLRLQPTALVDCSNREQYKTLIEDIYNFRSRNKINLRY
jgi:hypothetical protein